MIGVIQVILGLFCFGFLFNFVSHAVISGFTSASAIIICFSQLKNILGISIKGDSLIQILIETSKQWGSTNVLTLEIGSACVIILLFFKKKMPFFPAPLFVVVVGTLVVYGFGLDAMGVKTVGKVSRGLPALSLPTLNFANIKFFEERLYEAVVWKKDLQRIIIDCADVYDIDGVAVHTLDLIMREYTEKHIGVAFTGVIGPVRDLLAWAGWEKKYGDRINYFSIKQALTSLNIID